MPMVSSVLTGLEILELLGLRWGLQEEPLSVPWRVIRIVHSKLF